MKLLLTSAGYSNQSIVKALRELVGKDFAESNLVFIPTAANLEGVDKGRLIKDLVRCQKLGFETVGILDIAAVSTAIWQSRLEQADVIMVGGGNTSYLMGQIKRSGLAVALPDLLKTRVYVGVSAGSMVVAPDLQEEAMERLYEEPVYEDTKEGLGLVDFLVVPHFNSPTFPRVIELVETEAKKIETSLYAIDDQTAVQVLDGQVTVISEGQWKKFN